MNVSGTAQPKGKSLQRIPTLNAEHIKFEAQSNADRELPWQCFQDGTILDRLASEHWDAFTALFNGKRNFVPSREITMGSACTGSASDSLAAYFFTKAAQQRVSDQRFGIKNVFSCELNDQKRKWIQGVHREIAGLQGSTSSEPCVFKNILDLSAATARCVVHNGMCNVPECCIFVCCTSCKDISRLNNSSGVGGLVLQQTSSPGGSAQTFRGMLAYIEWARPAIILFENVEAIDDGGEGPRKDTNLDIVLSEFASRGYECQQMTGDTSRYGVPQRRMRCYIIAVLVVASSRINFLERSIEDTFKTLRSLIKVGQRKPPCASQVLYSGADARVVKHDVVIDSQIVGNGSQADCLVRNVAMDDSIGGS